MPLRIGFDMDGVLADFALGFREVETRLFGPGVPLHEGQPEEEEASQANLAEGIVRGNADGTEEGDAGADTQVPLKADTARDSAARKNRKAAKVTARGARRRRDAIWGAIGSTPNFWATLKPLDPGAVRRIHELMLRHDWEVFFITQRPRTEGDTVQRQTQKWLVEQGFDLPSVLVLGGSRGGAAGALRLNYHIDDSAQNCLDVISESSAKPILIVPDKDEKTIASARKLGIGTARSVNDCLDILEQASIARAQPGILARLATMVGWK